MYVTLALILVALRTASYPLLVVVPNVGFDSLLPRSVECRLRAHVYCPPLLAAAGRRIDTHRLHSEGNLSRPAAPLLGARTDLTRTRHPYSVLFFHGRSRCHFDDMHESFHVVDRCQDRWYPAGTTRRVSAPRLSPTSVCASTA